MLILMFFPKRSQLTKLKQDLDVFHVAGNGLAGENMAQSV